MKSEIAAALLAGAVMLSAAPAAAQQVVLRVAHFWPPSAMGPSKMLVPWCDKIAKESANRMVCQIYPSMQLGGTPPQLIQQAIDGVADIVWTLPGYTAGRFPAVEAFELPFMSNRAEPTSRALWEYCQKYCAKDFKGVKNLAFNVHDEGHVHSNKRAIKTLADFRGMKMRAPTRLTNKLLAALGATPVAMPLPAVPEAVSKGVVDGYLLPWEVIPTMKLEEMTKFHSETDPKSSALYTAVFTIAMNQARYDGLPADLKKIIDDSSGADFSAAIGKAWDESATEARKKVAAGGAQFHTLPASELESWRAVGDKLAESWVEEMNGRGYDGKAMLSDARALIAKHTAK
jgi:TRAP-type transport system periplasmic protein